jgi:hypothetical protein
MKYQNKSIHITSGLGFIGSSLARVLVAQGAQVTRRYIKCDRQVLYASEHHGAQCLFLPCHQQMMGEVIRKVFGASNGFRVK